MSCCARHRQITATLPTPTPRRKSGRSHRARASQRRWFVGGAIALFAWCSGANVFAQSPEWHRLVDYSKLKATLGSALPTGSGGTVSVVEGTDQTTKAYYVDGSSPQFNGDNDPLGTPVELIDASGGAMRGLSPHATNTVGGNFFGDLSSMAPGANRAVVYNAGHWMVGIIKYGSDSPPEPQNYRVQNHSWVYTMASGYPTPLPSAEHPDNVKILERFDYLVDRANGGDGMIATVALNNSQNPMPYLLSHSYNAVSVGRSDGMHSVGLTLPPDDMAPDSSYGPGRSKPDLVAPLGSTSASTAAVSSAATLLYSSATGLGAKGEVITATLLAGATKDEFSNWTHTPTQPLDDVYGAGELNIYNSYILQAGGIQPGRTTQPTAPVASNGWDYKDNRNSPTIGDVFYNINVPSGSRLSEFSVALTWNLAVTDGDPSAAVFSPSRSLKNLDLRFYNSTGQFLGTLLDQSISAVDNVEHLYLRGLGPGAYTLRVSGSAGVDYGLAWRSSSLFDAPSADFNRDRIVDGSDFLAWQQNVGKLVNATAAQGDADGDGDVDVEDLNLWRLRVVAPTGNPAAVPEPWSQLLALTAAGAWGAFGRRFGGG